MKTRKNDFIEIDFIAKTKDDNKIFDLTKAEDAKKFNIYNEKSSYSPVIICLGQNDVLPGLDESLIDKEPGMYTLDIPYEKAFGKKDHNLIKLVPTNVFHAQNIRPFPGLKVNLDGVYGNILSVSGGRTIVDFNHPLAGKNLVYEVEIKRIITDVREKLQSFLKLIDKNAAFSMDNNKVEIDAKLDNEKLKEEMVKEIKSRIPEVKEISFKKQPLQNK